MILFDLEQSTFYTLGEIGITLLNYWADGSQIVICLPLESIALVDRFLGQCLFVSAVGISFSHIFGREFRRYCRSSSG